jgi:hypothetical protein
MRTALSALATLVAAALLAAGAAAPSPSVKPIRWNASRQGPPFLVVGPHSVWVEALTASPGATTVWRVDPAQATTQPTPVTARILDLFPGAGTLWVSSIPLDRDRLLLDWIAIAHGFRLVPKAVPRTCDESDGGHSVAWGGRLWLTCRRFGVYVFAPHRRRPVDRVRMAHVQALLPAADGVWAATRSSVTAIGGASKGARIRLPRGFVVAGDYASNVSWAVSGSTVWAIGRGPGKHPELIRLNLKRGAGVAYPITVPDAGFLGGGIAIAGDEIWFGDEPRARLIRYRRKHPGKPLGYIELPGHGAPKDGFFRVDGGAGAAWVDVQRRDGFHLFRVATP